MSGEPACPSDDTLVRFLTGRTRDEERDQIGRHVDVCSTCAHVLAMPDSQPRTGGGRAAAGAPLGTSLQGGDVLADRYRIVRLLGAGGMGEVYEAFDLVLNERIALKTVRATIADDARAVERLKSEVQLARKVTHPNVCRIFDFGIHRPDASASDAFPFLTMELLPGTTLARLLVERGAPAPAQILAIARQIAGGLAAAHAVGVIHKDLKSDNVLLTPSGGHTWRATVTDFGLAAAHDLVDAVSHAPHFSGTPGYVAPERMAGAAATTASDVYALGIVLVDLLSGSLPTRRTAEPVLPPGLAALHGLARRCRAPRASDRPGLGDVVAELNRAAGEALRAGAASSRWLLGAGIATAALAAAIVLVRTQPDRQPVAGARTVTPAAVPPAVATTPVQPPVVPAVAATLEPVPPPAKPPARPRRVHSAPAAARAPASPAPPAVIPANALNEPIRTLAPAKQARRRDDAPIDILPHAP